MFYVYIYILYLFSTEQMTAFNLTVHEGSYKKRHTHLSICLSIRTNNRQQVFKANAKYLPLLTYCVSAYFTANLDKLQKTGPQELCV